MKYAHQQFQVEQLRQRNLITVVTSLAVIIFSLFVSAILPSLLIRYVYANQQLLAQPKLLEYIPIAAFALGVGYALYAVFTIFNREKNARRLENEIEEMVLLDDDCCGGCCGGNCSHDSEWGDLQELDAMVEEVMEEVEKEQKSTSAKKSSKKSPTKKTKKTNSKSKK